MASVKQLSRYQYTALIVLEFAPHGQTYQTIIMRNEERIWGRPKQTLVMTGQNSAKLPAGRRYEMTWKCIVRNLIDFATIF
jgi:hypothetical protein